MPLRDVVVGFAASVAFTLLAEAWRGVAVAFVSSSTSQPFFRKLFSRAAECPIKPEALVSEGRFAWTKSCL